jgi:LysR family glycine cleavage system transcriptional activator
MTKLPPLHALRCFDAVARLGGVRLAAQTLFVTPAAVTQQVKLLERSLGVTLLQRDGRNVSLTDAGRRLHQGTARHLKAIAQAADLVRPRPHRVRVTTVPSFAVRWLVPRLKGFTDRHPGIEVQVDADPRLADLGQGDWDLAIREGHGHYAGTKSRRLLTLEALPVCSPSYAKQTFGRLPTKAWAKARLLHEVAYRWWQPWLTQAGVRDLDPIPGLHFSHTAMAIAAALDGQGVALVPTAFVAKELEDGSLVTPLRQKYLPGVELHVVWPTAADHRLSAEATSFRDWVLDEAASG